MPKLKLTGNQFIHVSDKTAAKITEWKQNNSMPQSKLVDVGTGDFLMLSDIRGIMNDEDYTVKSEADRLDITNEEDKIRIQFFDTEVGNRNINDYLHDKGIVTANAKYRKGAVKSTRTNDYREAKRLWSGLHELKHAKESLTEKLKNGLIERKNELVETFRFQ